MRMINDQASLVPRKIDNSLLFSADFSNGAVPLIILSAVKHDVREAVIQRQHAFVLLYF